MSYFDKEYLKLVITILKRTNIILMNALSVLSLKVFFVTLALTRTFYMTFWISLWMNYSGCIWILQRYLACFCDWMHLWVSYRCYTFWIIHLNSLIMYLPATLNSPIFVQCHVIRELQNLYNSFFFFKSFLVGKIQGMA